MTSSLSLTLSLLSSFVNSKLDRVAFASIETGRLAWVPVVFLLFSLAWDYRSLPIKRSGFKRTNSEPSSIALQVEGLRQQNKANRSHGDLNSVDHKCNSEIPVQFSHKSTATNGDSGSTSSSTSSPPASPLPSAASVSTSTCLSAQEELDQFPGSHFPFSGLSM